MKLIIGHLYPELMCIYGDRGNVLALSRRASWHGLDVEVRPILRQDRVDFAEFDIVIFGGGQDKEQILVCRDLAEVKGASLRDAALDGLVILSICGGFQLLGHYYQPHHGDRLPGLGVFDAYTVAGSERFIGNVVIEAPFLPEGRETVVGFENHSGLTHLGPQCQPFGKVIKGKGNNGKDAMEGAVQGNCFGTYLHGPLLPKNPLLADHLIRLALTRRFGNADLRPLKDQLEQDAHAAAIQLPR